MLSIKKCDDVLRNNGIDITEEEVKNIRAILYGVAQLQVDIQQNDDYEKSNFIYPSFN